MPPVTSHGVPAGLLGDVGDGGVAATDERRRGRVEGGGVGADATHALLAGRGPHREAGRRPHRAGPDDVTRAQAHRVVVGVEDPARDGDAVGAGVGTAGTAAGVERVGRQRVEGVAADHHVVGAGRVGREGQRAQHARPAVVVGGQRLACGVPDDQDRVGAGGTAFGVGGQRLAGRDVHGVEVEVVGAVAAGRDRAVRPVAQHGVRHRRTAGDAGRGGQRDRALVLGGGERARRSGRRGELTQDADGGHAAGGRAEAGDRLGVHVRVVGPPGPVGLLLVVDERRQHAAGVDTPAVGVEGRAAVGRELGGVGAARRLLVHLLVPREVVGVVDVRQVGEVGVGVGPSRQGGDVGLLGGHLDAQVEGLLLGRRDGVVTGRCGDGQGWGDDGQQTGTPGRDHDNFCALKRSSREKTGSSTACR